MMTKKKDLDCKTQQIYTTKQQQISNWNYWKRKGEPEIEDRRSEQQLSDGYMMVIV